MIDKQTFIAQVKSEVIPQLSAKDKKRQIEWIVGGLVALFLVLVAVVVWYPNLRMYLQRREWFEFWWGLLAPLTLLGVWLYVCMKGSLEEQKKEVSTTLLQLLGEPNEHYDSRHTSLCKPSCLFSPFGDSWSENGITSRYEKTPFSVADVILWGGQRNASKVFEGILLTIELEKSFPGYVLLFNTRWPLVVPILKKIRLGNIPLSKHYQIYTNDPIEARCLVTPLFMEKLNTLKKHFKNKRIDVSFFENHAVFAIYTHHRLVEPYTSWKIATTTNTKTYERFYDTMQVFHDMIHTLRTVNNALPKAGPLTSEVRALGNEVIRKRDEFPILIMICGIYLLLGICIVCFILDK